MERIKKWDRATIRSIRPGMDDALNELRKYAETLGLSIELGDCSFSEVTATFKLNVSVKDGNGNTVNEEAEAFKRYASMVGIKGNLHQTFKHKTKTFTITGMSTTMRGKNIVKIEDERGGKYNCPVSLINQYF